MAEFRAETTLGAFRGGKHTTIVIIVALRGC